MRLRILLKDREWALTGTSETGCYDYWIGQGIDSELGLAIAGACLNTGIECEGVLYEIEDVEVVNQSSRYFDAPEYLTRENTKAYVESVEPDFENAVEGEPLSK